MAESNATPKYVIVRHQNRGTLCEVCNRHVVELQIQFSKKIVYLCTACIDDTTNKIYEARNKE